MGEDSFVNILVRACPDMLLSIALRQNSLSTKASSTTTALSTCLISVATSSLALILSLLASTIAVALWAMESVAISPQLNVTIDTVLEGGVGGIVANNPAWSPEGRV